MNPPLRAPVAESKADDVLLMQLTPADYEALRVLHQKLRVESAKSYSTKLSMGVRMRLGNSICNEQPPLS